MKFKTIEEIRAHEFGGNYLLDSNAFNAIDQFFLDTRHSIADRAEAIRIMDEKGMGLEADLTISDEDLVEQAVSEFNDQFEAIERARALDDEA